MTSAPIRSHPLPSAPGAEGHPTTLPLPPAPIELRSRGRERNGLGDPRANGDDQNKDLPLPFSSGEAGDLPDQQIWPAGPIDQEADLWGVVRCSSATTLRLAQELRSYGLVAWAPVHRYQRRLPRRRKMEWVTAPMIPSFVFVAQKDENIALALAQRGKVSQCKVFVFNEERVQIPGWQLVPLQEAERKGTAKTRRHLRPGDLVEILAGLLHLQKGKVISGKKRNDSYTVELEEQKTRVTFPGFLLRLVLV